VKRVQIRKVARLGTGHTPSRSVEAYWDPAECTIPWLTLADVWQLRDGSVSVIHDTKESISPLGLANSAAVRHPAGTVALSRTASVGFSCLLGTDMATSQDFVTWTCGPQLDPRYLLWVLRAERDDILRRTQGSTHKTIYMPDIEQLTIPLPPLDKQRRIAAMLERRTDQITSLIGLKRKLAGLVQERTSLVLDHVLGFGDSTRVELRRVVDPRRPIMYGIVLPGPDNPGGPVVVKGGNVREGTITGHLCGTTVEIEAGYKRSRLATGDTIVVIRGAGAGRVGEVPSGLDGANITQDVARIAPGSGLDGTYLRLLLQSADCQRQLANRVGGAAITGINIGDLKRVQIPLLPIDEQRRRASHGEQVVARSTSLLRDLEAQIELLREHRTALAYASVNGDLKVA